ncbi:MAG: hypothetical protein QM756_09640 [Polyangiaceae bacterium]
MIVQLSPKVYSTQDIEEMKQAFAGYFARGEKYAVLTVSPLDAEAPDASERRALTQWANEPTVAENARRLCVGGATVVPNALVRGAVTALMWFWTPPFPHKAVANVEEGLDFCEGQLAAGGVAMPRGAGAMRIEISTWLRAHR